MFVVCVCACVWCGGGVSITIPLYKDVMSTQVNTTYPSKVMETGMKHKNFMEMIKVPLTLKISIDEQNMMMSFFSRTIPDWNRAASGAHDSRRPRCFKSRSISRLKKWPNCIPSPNSPIPPPLQSHLPPPTGSITPLFIALPSSTPYHIIMMSESTAD